MTVSLPPCFPDCPPPQTQTRLDAVQGATDEAIEDYFAVFQRALDAERAAAWEANAAVFESTLKRCATRVGDYHRALHVMRSASVAIQQQFEAERAADPFATTGGGGGGGGSGGSGSDGNADKPKGKVAAPATDAQLTNAERTAATARVQRLQQLYARLDNVRFPIWSFSSSLDLMHRRDTACVDYVPASI